MVKVLPWLAAGILLFPTVIATRAAAGQQPPVQLLTRADVLPLALEPGNFTFRKEKLFFLESLDYTRLRPSDERSITFERKYYLFGAVTPNDERDRYGNYFTLYWRSRRPADLVVRLEYRQARLGPFVQAREVAYPDTRPGGNHRTDFQVTGDDYQRDGRVLAWRALLIERRGPPGTPGGRIVALTQSALWR